MTFASTTSQAKPESLLGKQKNGKGWAVFWVRAESLLTFFSACTNLCMFLRDWERAAHKDTLHAWYLKGSLSDCSNGRELVGICMKLACTEELRYLSPEGNSQGNINWAFWKDTVHFQQDDNMLSRSQPLGCLMICANSMSGSLSNGM